MIAGIYGMNFQSIPELHYAYGYPVCLAVMLGIDLALWWRSRRPAGYERTRPHGLQRATTGEPTTLQRW